MTDNDDYTFAEENDENDENDEYTFAEEKDKQNAVPGQATWKIMLVDDEPALHDVTRVAIGHIVYKGKPLEFIDAYSGEQAKQLIKKHPDTVLILLDVIMEQEDAGLRVVQYIREELKNHFVRIVLRTGQPGQVPETEIILNYDINDYKEKTELTKQKLLTTIISCLRSYHDMMLIEESRHQLEQNERALLLAKRAAESANKAKTTFFANMGHELRTPLNAIIGYSEMLEEEAEYLGMQQCISDINKIHQAGTHLLRLLSGILDLSKIEADKLEIHPEHFEIAAALEKVVNEVKPLITQNGNSLSVHCAEGINIMYSDRDKLHLILFSLLSNASKFTHEGYITLDAAQTSVNNVVWVTFTVTDTGIGMSAEELKHVFQPFRQLDDSSTRQYEGAGLGLALVQSYCEAMGGHISVESKPRKGSTFIVQLPRDILQII